MLGAIIGDIVGSAYEFNPTNDYNFELFPANAGYTDDTICTIAVADALLQGRDFGAVLHEWCRRYPHPKGGYGGRFARWVQSDNPIPYGSFGNGSAMRVSSIGWLAQSPEELVRLATASAACTHNHELGINGAISVAVAINDALEWQRSNYPFDEKIINRENIYFHALRHALMIQGYDTICNNFHLNLDSYRNKFNETCQGTVPVALHIVMNSTSFEDALRQAVSLGADADTLGAIVGSIAEAIWGIPEWMKSKALSYLPNDMRIVLNEFRRRVQQQKAKPSPKIAPEWINSLRPNEVFVFGSNLAGHHGGGAARTAYRRFGAQWGVGVGHTGQCYAIPTMHGGLEAIRPYVKEFILRALANPQTEFLLTRIGCGIAGFTDAEMCRLFKGGIDYPSVLKVPNIAVPKHWLPLL